MISDCLFLASALLPPLLLRKRWLVALLSLLGSTLAAVMGWNAGLREDVPPIMLIFGFAGAAIFVLILAVAIHALKEWLRVRLSRDERS